MKASLWIIFTLQLNLSYSQIESKVEKRPSIRISTKVDSNPLLTMGDQQFREKFQDKIMPSFDFKDINDKTISSSKFEGKNIHINFWSVTCKFCIQEFEELNELKKKYSDSFIYISFAPESIEKVKGVIDKFPLDYIVIPNAQKFYEELGIDGYPKNFFIDKNGIIKFVTDGSYLKKDFKTNEYKSANFKYYDELMSKLQ